MITRLEIENFRGLKRLTLSDLRRVNLLVGGNDVGKTSVLEMMVLLFGNSSTVSSLPYAFRNNQGNGHAGSQGDDRENYWNWLFHDRNSANKIRVTATDDRGVCHLLHSKPTSMNGTGSDVDGLFRGREEHPNDLVLRFDPSSVGSYCGEPEPALKTSLVSVRPSHPILDAELFNQISLERDGEERFQGLMQKIDGRIRRLRYAKLPGTSSPLVYADLGLSRLIPVTQMGQAFNRLFHIYAELLVSRAKVLLVDEIENGIYYDNMAVIWKGLLEICAAEQAQIFATTHSRECVMAAHTAESERGRDELCVQRLQLVKGQVEAARLVAKQLELAAEMGLEVRS